MSMLTSLPEKENEAREVIGLCQCCRKLTVAFVSTERSWNSGVGCVAPRGLPRTGAKMWSQPPCLFSFRVCSNTITIKNIYYKHKYRLKHSWPIRIHIYFWTDFVNCLDIAPCSPYVQIINRFYFLYNDFAIYLDITMSRYITKTI